MWQAGGTHHSMETQSTLNRSESLSLGGSTHGGGGSVHDGVGASISLKMLQEHFCYNLDEAASRLGVCRTKLKQVCVPKAPKP